MNFFKKLTTIVMVLALIICTLPFSVSSLNLAGGDFYFQVDTTTETATLVDYRGNGGDVIIPSYYTIYPVVSIDESVFSGNTTITKVTIPDSIKTIGGYAFNGCTNLKRVSIPSSVTSMGISVFNGCTALQYVELNAEIESVPQNTFYNCTSLSTIKLNSNIRAIGNAAFYNCTSLKNVPTASFESYGQRAFFNTGIVSLTVSERVADIPNYAFSGCANLERVVFMGKDTTIDDTAFNKSNAELTIYCKQDSPAQQYAINFIYKYVIIDSDLGDTNADGYISISDVTAIQKHCASILVIDDEIKKIYGDVNGDGQITIRDATYIQMYLAKIIEVL